MNSRVRRPSIVGFISFLVVSFLLSGCMADKRVAGNEKEVIRIALSTKSSYNFSIGDFVTAAFPNFQVELIEMEPDYKPIPEEQYEKKLKQEKPDLVLLGYSGKYPGLAAHGVLEDLSVRLQASGMKPDDFYPGMIDKIKREGGGNLYALASSFQASVLYYNADLFHKYMVDLPRNGMTIMDVMQLASQFAKAGSRKDGIVGYHQPFSSMPNSLLLSLSDSEGLQSYNFQTGKVTVDTPAWRSVFATVVDLYKNGTFMMQDVKGDMVDGTLMFDEDAVNEADLFKQGKSAMTIDRYNSVKGMKFETGMVTPPVSSIDTSRSVHLGVYDYMAIPAGARNADAAWQIIEFMLSDYVAKAKSGIQDASSMPTRRSYMSYDHNPVLAELYETFPSIDRSYSLEGYDPKFLQLFQELEDREVKAAVNGEKSVDACIAAVQKEGQALLEAAKPRSQ
ncbi:extracellular solute-binding protein [Paenibacillus sp. CF384]|uniref:ABC transporter substrate-binding protein n=1 Tax=Paenibacillus sp. CF384 TaxID=1884382 RepID=UPI000897ECCA|nr:extracellular solute-binding protein [Paenibacillus sp. CF384]SDX72263.1 multiple sugar transport system substrate-binding protein [Paenibacillus sp. CF384]